MERNRTSPSNPRASRTERQLAPLKLISRLLSHELHAQQNSRVALSREEILEIQTSLDIYIETTLRTRGPGNTTSAMREVASEIEVQALPSRVN